MYVYSSTREAKGDAPNAPLSSQESFHTHASHLEGLGGDGGQAFQGLESEWQMEVQESRSGLYLQTTPPSTQLLLCDLNMLNKYIDNNLI